MRSAIGALHLITSRLDRGEIDGGQFLDALVRMLTQVVGCARAGVWLYADPPRHRVLHCIAMFDAVRGERVQPTDMDGSHDGRYFEALEADGLVLADNARTHPATASFLHEYLLPQDVHSVLDVGFSINGTPIGVFTCEQVGAPQAWTGRQVQLLRAIGPRAALSLLRTAARPVETAPGALWEPSDPLARLTRPLQV